MTLNRNKLVNKKENKLIEGDCRICGESDYNLLDVHRLEHGKRYNFGNTCVLCCKCHRKHHTGSIKIHKWVFSTNGYLLYWTDEQGNEQFT